ncbi:MAG TPA: nuclear transport factor 2 family protein [Candidatus Binataceae bacterium]|nr:nuclear transport factor 2 family protein [Candidatus Binataceae bacterium]
MLPKSQITHVTRPGFLAVIALAAILFSAGLAHAAQADAEIEELEDRFAAAVRAKDINGIMANYMHNPSLVVFDLIPPLQYTGWHAYKADWQKVLDGCKDAPTFEISDLTVYGGATYSYGYSIQHFACTGTDGKKIDLMLRVTDGYTNFGGQWLIGHEHVSVPVDLQTGKADFQSKP